MPTTAAHPFYQRVNALLDDYHFDAFVEGVREAFWRGWRLVGVDGTQFSLINTPQITATAKKARTRRGRAAFAKITTAVLLEIGLHNPLAAAIGRHGESEWALGQRLLAQLPKRALLLGDRLYGVVAFARVAHAICCTVGSHFLLRTSRAVKPRVIKRLRDGSRLIGLPVRAPRNPNRILEWLEVREIRVRVTGDGHRPHELRLWTTLLDPRTAPALVSAADFDRTRRVSRAPRPACNAQRRAL